VCGNTVLINLVVAGVPLPPTKSGAPPGPHGKSGPPPPH
jgi:hypothetical protein